MNEVYVSECFALLNPFCAVDADAVNHPIFPEGAIIPIIFLCQLLIMRIGPLLGDVDDRTRDIQVAVHIAGVEDQAANVRVSDYVFVLARGRRGVEQQDVTLHAEPHGRQQRVAILGLGMQHDERARFRQQQVAE